MKQTTEKIAAAMNSIIRHNRRSRHLATDDMVVACSIVMIGNRGKATTDSSILDSGQVCALWFVVSNFSSQ